MTGPAPVHAGPPFPTSDEVSAGTGGPVGVQTCSRCGNIRRESALVPVADGWQCREPCHKPGGRPAIGPPVLIRFPPELRAAVEDRAQPGETLAATVRRLLTQAVMACPECGGSVRPAVTCLGCRQLAPADLAVNGYHVRCAPADDPSATARPTEPPTAGLCQSCGLMCRLSAQTGLVLAD